MESNMSKIIAGIVALIVLAGGVVLFTGSDDDTADTDTATTSQQSETVSDEQPAAEETGSTIVELAQATDALSTLVDAVVAGELVETLSSDGPYTVFAPTNDAFAALPDGTLESLLLPENQANLADILTFHVVAGEVFAADLSDGQVVTTVQGDTLTVSITDGVVKIGDATVVTPDVDASNGVVHVIDSVLLPS